MAEKVKKPPVLEEDPLPADEDVQTAEKVQEDVIVEEADGAVDDDEDLGPDPA